MSRSPVSRESTVSCRSNGGGTYAIPDANCPAPAPMANSIVKTNTAEMKGCGDEHLQNGRADAPHQEIQRRRNRRERNADDKKEQHQEHIWGCTKIP